MGNGYRGDIALDDVTLASGPCSGKIKDMYIYSIHFNFKFT